MQWEQVIVGDKKYYVERGTVINDAKVVLRDVLYVKSAVKMPSKIKGAMPEVLVFWGYADKVEIVSNNIIRIPVNDEYVEVKNGQVVAKNKGLDVSNALLDKIYKKMKENKNG